MNNLFIILIISAVVALNIVDVKSADPEVPSAVEDSNSETEGGALTSSGRKCKKCPCPKVVCCPDEVLITDENDPCCCKRCVRSK